MRTLCACNLGVQPRGGDLTLVCPQEVTAVCSQDGGFQGWRNAYRPPRPTSPVSQRLGARDRKWWPRRHRSCLCHEPSTQFRVQARRSGPRAVLPNHKFSRYLRSTCPVTSTGLRAEDTGTETALSLKEHTRSPVRGGLRPQRWPCRGTGMLGGSPGCSQACRGSRLSRGGVGGGVFAAEGYTGSGAHGDCDSDTRTA